MDYHSDRAVLHPGRRLTCLFEPTQGEIVARAKRTDRAEARRRYRAYLVEQTETEAAKGGEDEEPSVRSAGDRPAKAAGPAGRPAQRVGFLGAFKAATRPVHYVDDLRYAPTLIFRTNAIWPGALLSFVALAYGFTRTDYNDGSIQVVVNFVLPMVPMIQPMLAGFLAPRATWLAGIIASVISGICFEILIIWYASGHLANTPKDFGVGSGAYTSLTLQVILSAITFGALLGAGSGWYKRFLNLTGPAATLAKQQAANQKQSARRPSARR
jgi:hypothetical protein